MQERRSPETNQGILREGEEEMKLDAGWKRILFWISFVLIFIRIGYIGVRGEVDKEYYVSEEYAGYDLSAASETECKDITIYFKSAQSRLNSLELIFDNIPDISSIVFESEILCSFSSFTFS